MVRRTGVFNGDPGDWFGGLSDCVFWRGGFDCAVGDSFRGFDWLGTFGIAFDHCVGDESSGGGADDGPDHCFGADFFGWFGFWGFHAGYDDGGVGDDLVDDHGVGARWF